MCCRITSVGPSKRETSPPLRSFNVTHRYKDTKRQIQILLASCVCVSMSVCCLCVCEESTLLSFFFGSSFSLLFFFFFFPALLFSAALDFLPVIWLHCQVSS